MFFLSRKIAIFLFVTVLALSLGLFGMVSSKASETAPATFLHAVSGIDANLDGPAGNAAPAKKFAVVIGIVYDNYELGSINFADQDAASVYNLLTGQWGFPAENVILLQNGNATRDNIVRALTWLAGNPEIDSGADVVFYYSGHGLRNGPDVGINNTELGSGYALVPFDFMGFDYKKGDGLLWDWYLAGLFSRMSPGRMWITIDSCNSGGFNRPGITGPNRVVTLSSQGDQLSSEIPDTARGVFTQYMIEEGVARGVPVEQAFWAAAPRAAEGYGQNPQIADNYAGNLDLSRPSATD